MKSPIFTSPSSRLVFNDVRQVMSTNRISEVYDVLREVEVDVDRGYYAAGFISYEAAPAFDPAFKVNQPSDLPLIWFGIFTQREHIPHPTSRPRRNAGGASWRELITKSEYRAGFDFIKQNIACGQCYQVNYTFPLECTLLDPPQELFDQLYRAQPVDYAAFLDIEDYEIITLSPELFWSLNGVRIVSKPMKGTRTRGRDQEEDERLAYELRNSPKEKAENVMIVDMIRNDLGRIARTGSVRVDRLFELEEYKTVWQMISTISAETEVGLPEIMKALFPPASVTGAPKVKTLEIIATVEPFPRQVYCGTVGWWGPDRRACFNVAIRTLIRRKADGRTRYSVGSGITWDSDGNSEYEECLLKAAVLI